MEVISGFWPEVFNLINSGSIEFEEFLNMMRRKMKENENNYFEGFLSTEPCSLLILLPLMLPHNVHGRL